MTDDTAAALFATQETLQALLARIDTARLRRSDEDTVALVVLNPAANPVSSGRVQFHAAYPIRPETLPARQAVIVREESGSVVPSRLLRDTLSDASDLPSGRRLRTLILEIAVADVPAHGGRAYGATYCVAPESRSADDAFWKSLEPLDLRVVETDCHVGNLPPTFRLL